MEANLLIKYTNWLKKEEPLIVKKGDCLIRLKQKLKLDSN